MLREGKDLDLAARGIKEGSESDLRVGSALDGKIQRSDLSLTERKLYDVLRGKFDHLLDRYVKSAASSDKSYRDIVYRANKREAPNPNWTPDELKAYELMMRRVKDYLPHIFDRDALLAEFKVEAAQIRQKLSTEIQSSKLNFQKSRLRELESSIQKLQGGELVTYDSLPTSIRMRFFEPRKGKKGYSLSAVKAYRTYLSGIRRKLYDEPAVRVAAELHKSLDPSLREYNKWYVRRYLGWDKHKLDSLAGAISSFQWMRTLGLNPRSAVVNLTQRINTITEVGPKYSLAGQKAAFTRAGKEAFDRTGIAREIPQVLLEGDSPVGMENVRAIVGYLFNKVELGNRRHAFLSGRAKALASGKSEPQASRAGVDTVHRTQFRYGRVGMPRVLSHPVGRIGLQFWSYPIKQMELIVRWAKTDPKKLLTYIALAEGGKETLKQLLNVDLSNALGFGMNLGEAIQALRDIPDGDFRGFFRHMRLAMSEGGGMLPSGLGPTPSSLLKVIEKAKESRGLEALGKELSPVMTNRMVQTYKAITKRHVDKEGKGLYPIYNQDKQLMYYLTGKQLLMRSIGPRSATETKQYVDFRKDYLLDKEHQDILRDITRAIIDGNDKKANLLINKYGLVPSEKALVNEALRRELPYEERREINKTQRQREWETIREGEE